jgi:hypothetical protein
MRSPENVANCHSAEKNKAVSVTAGYDTGGALEKGASGGKKCQPFPLNQAKL